MDDNSQRTYVLNRAIESVVGSWSFAGGLVQSGGDIGARGAGAGLSGAGGITGTGAGAGGDGGLTATGVDGATGGALGGGVCGDSSSSDDLAGLPRPDSL